MSLHQCRGAKNCHKIYKNQTSSPREDKINFEIILRKFGRNSIQLSQNMQYKHKTEQISRNGWLISMTVQKFVPLCAVYIKHQGDKF